MLLPPVDQPTWVGLTDGDLPVSAAQRWTSTPGCGAVVTFTGIVRDHAEGRPGVNSLTYEAYEEQATSRMAGVVADARVRWPALVRVAALHRVGTLAVGEPAVVVTVGSAHRGDAFAAAAYCIDTLKATVPIWKLESWSGGQAWGTDAKQIGEVDDGSRAGSGPIRTLDVEADRS